MKSSEGFTIIIPAFNEADSVAGIIEDIQKLKGTYEIIVIDDGSTDGTTEEIGKTGVLTLRHQSNRGYGASLKTGIKNAKYDTIVITDADGTYPNEQIPELVKIFKSEGLDMVVGARTTKRVEIPLIRRPAKWLITRLASYLSKTEIPDLNSGLRVMKKEVVEKFIKILPDGFSFTTTITLAMITNNYSVKYLPVDYFKRSGKSKIRPIYDTLNFIQLIIRMVLYFDPLRIFLPISLPLFFGGLILTIFQAIFLRNISTISVIILLSGVQLLAIGMLADLIDKRNG
ncbi:MAG: glycosyltransferase family 2 protein [Thermodesulfobacteriota bacterium]